MAEEVAEPQLKELDLANKSPQKDSAKKVGKSLKEKRAVKKAKQTPAKLGTPKPA